MNLQEYKTEVAYFERVFDVVRLVEPETKRLVELKGDSLVPTSVSCFNVWGRSEKCTNCITSYVFNTRRKNIKFELLGDDICIVAGRKVEVEGTGYVMECILVANCDTLIGSDSHNRFMEQISIFNKKLYRDPLTHVHNRRFYDEQVSGLRYQGLAFIDLDLFKEVNDRFGHSVGDLVLEKAAGAISACVRYSDRVIRLGGDEFLLAFETMPEDRFCQILEEVRESVNALVIREDLDLKISVSIGGVYGEAPASCLIEYADRALYEAKRERNCVKVYRYGQKMNFLSCR